MELAELMTLRPQPAAGLLLTLTGRCPLHCTHCSTQATMNAPEPDAGQLHAFIDSFTPAEHPSVLMLTGGEPLLRPDTVTALATTTRTTGTKTALLTGAFFTRHTPKTGNGKGAGAPVPDRIWRAITALDHFSVSLDAFHERETDRGAVFALVRRVLDTGIPTSFHLTGTGPDDPYLTDITTAIRHTFADHVPMLVNSLRPIGRAASWAIAHTPPPDPARVQPCAMAAWPVVATDGTILACCNQHTVDYRPPPPHLTLGHIATDPWPTIATRTRDAPILRMIRTTGPAYLLHHHTPRPTTAPRGYCTGCHALPDHPTALAAAQATAAGPVGALLDQHAAHTQTAAGPTALVQRHGCAAYADLVTLNRTTR